MIERDIQRERYMMSMKLRVRHGSREEEKRQVAESKA